MSVRGFLNDDRGTVTVEFVLIFPLLALWLGASFIFFDAFKTTSQAAKAAYTIADIVSRQPVIPPNYIDDLHTLQENLLPRAPQGKWLRLTSIQYIEDPDLDGDGQPDAKYHKVLWSRAKPLAVDQNGNTNEMVDADIPTEVIPTMSPGDSIVLVENFVPYTSIPIPLLNELNFTGLEWRNRIPVRPRFSSQVVLNGSPYSPAPVVQTAAVDPVDTTSGNSSNSGSSSDSPSFQETNTSSADNPSGSETPGNDGSDGDTNASDPTPDGGSEEDGDSSANDGDTSDGSGDSSSQEPTTTASNEPTGQTDDGSSAATTEAPDGGSEAQNSGSGDGGDDTSGNSGNTGGEPSGGSDNSSDTGGSQPDTSSNGGNDNNSPGQDGGNSPDTSNQGDGGGSTNDNPSDTDTDDSGGPGDSSNDDDGDDTDTDDAPVVPGFVQ